MRGLANMNVHPGCTSTLSSEWRVKAAVPRDWVAAWKPANPKCSSRHNTHWQPTVAKPYLLNTTLECSNHRQNTNPLETPVRDSPKSHLTTAIPTSPRSSMSNQRCQSKLYSYQISHRIRSQTSRNHNPDVSPLFTPSPASTHHGWDQNRYLGYRAESLSNCFPSQLRAKCTHLAGVRRLCWTN